MKKAILVSGFIISTLVIFGQDSNLTKIYGGRPTANENMEWQDNLSPIEKYVGVIQVDSTVSATEIIEAFIITFQPIQDANIMTKQMRTNSIIGGFSAAVSGDYDSMNDLAEAGDADSRRQYQSKSNWTVQFIDGVRLNRFYYNVSIQAKKGRYKLTVTPAGISGYGLDHIQFDWSNLYKNGKVKKMNIKRHHEMKIKLGFTIDQWIQKVEKHLSDMKNDDW